MNKYRLSSYTIFVELDEKERCMLVHGYTGTIDIVSREVASFIRYRGPFVAEEFPFSDETLGALTRRGYLTFRTAPEERRIVQLMARSLHLKRKQKITGFMFLVTYKCNFRCPYCFETDVAGNEAKRNGKALTKTMVDRTFEAMREIEPDREKHFREITLYGGEPLLKENREIVRYIVEKGREKGYVFDAITNGYDLDHFEELLGPDAIRRVQITVDGDSRWHNRRRLHYLKNETFDKIVKNIGIALKHDVKVDVRVNADSLNIDSVSSLKELFGQLGYDKHPKFYFYLALITDLKHPESARKCEDRHCASESQPAAAGANKPVSLLSRREFNEKVRKMDTGIGYQYEDIAESIFNAISKREQLPFAAVGCGVQSGYYIFDPEGRIYTCWDTVGGESHVFGHYLNRPIEWNTSEVDKWQKRNVGTVARCSCCKYAFFCGGGCLSKTFLAQNGGDKPFCNDFPDIFRYSAQTAYRKYQARQTPK